VLSLLFSGRFAMERDDSRLIAMTVATNLSFKLKKQSKTTFSLHQKIANQNI